MADSSDVFGQAIHDFARSQKPEVIRVESDRCDDDIMPVSYLFRSLDEMPELEQIAMDLAGQSVLDVGSGAGCHAIELKNRGKEVTCLDTSAGAVEILKLAGLNALQGTIFDISSQKFDTILLLMNGIGIAGTMEDLPDFLKQLKNLLNPGGKILCDSTDISYLYQEEDGSFLIDLNDRYYGEMKFNMTYKNLSSGWFNWIYIDFDNLSNLAEQAGLKSTLIQEGENNQYLVALEHA